MFLRLGCFFPKLQILQVLFVKTLLSVQIELHAIVDSYNGKPQFNRFTLFKEAHKAKNVKIPVAKKLIDYIATEYKKFLNAQSQGNGSSPSNNIALSPVEQKAVQQGDLGKIFAKLPEAMRTRILAVSAQSTQNNNRVDDDSGNGNDAALGQPTTQ